jgi:hypothetical protein
MEWLDEGDVQLVAAPTRMRVAADAHARPSAAGADGHETASDTRIRVQPGAHARGLHFKNDADNAAHQRSCESTKTCPWCRYLAFQKKWGAHFRMLDEDKANGDPRLDRKQRAIATMSWLGKAHAADGEILLGCVACNALGAKALGNPLACFAAPAARLVAASCKPHVLLRHTRCKLHDQAVAKFLGVEGGASASSKPFLAKW